LADLGRRVQAVFGRPQDVEFAFDADGRCWLVQARPITTLYPLPAVSQTGSTSSADADLRVYFSVNVAQGVLGPLTPMGVQAMRLLAGSLGAAFGSAPSDRYAGPASIVEAGHRLFIDVTPVMRHKLGRRIFLN